MSHPKSSIPASSDLKRAVPTIEEQTGWSKRSTAVSLCQDWDVLRAVRQWDFDLNDPEFLNYAEGRGVLYKAGVIGSERFRFTGDHSVTEADFKNHPYFQRSLPSEKYPDGFRYSESALELHRQIMWAAKGALQDCWQLFCASKKPAMQAVS